MANKKKTSFTLSATAIDNLKQISDSMGISASSVLELLIRQKQKGKATEG